jgi:ubiquinone/menaquinone biosynthesis C-methylase UbiE
MNQSDIVRAAFAGQALAFEDAARHFGADDVLEWLVANTPVKSGDVVLEVAAGTGIYGRAIARSVSGVVAVDLTPEMLNEGKRSADNSGIRNMVWQVGDATKLPFLPQTFDLVISRLAIHHFEHPAVPITEMVRVTRPGGSIVVVDMIALDEHSQDRFNDLEKRRDPSHTRALTRFQLRDSIESAGCSVTHSATRVNVLNAQRWLDQTATSSKDADVIRAAWTGEIAGGPATGMMPTLGPDGIEFVHHWDLHVASVRSRG